MVRLARKSSWTSGRGDVGLGGGPSHRWRNRADVPGAGRGKSGSVSRASARGCAKAAGKVLGTPRGNEHGAALARPREDTASSRTARSGLWLVHRRVRHARSERGQGVLNALSPPPDAPLTSKDAT